ncbi:MAG: homoserine dehydrogenase [Phycisphaerales bacterium]|nr:homoserine dehydrogenase [Phycisphaerales bacterium]
MADKIGIGIIGCGAVGSAVVRILLEQGRSLTARTGLDLELRHVIVQDTHKERPVDIPKDILSNDPAQPLADPDTHIILELIGGVDTPMDLILEALRCGKDVVTANKALLALRGGPIFAAAREAGRCIAFEAAVGGGIPLIESVRRGLIANEIDAVYGILNGTCNYILTRMLESEVSYSDALAEAQQLGYAEADPTLDVDGTDSAHKLAILASIAMRKTCDYDRISVRGITDLEVTDLLAGDELGYVCKLLAIAQKHDNGLDLTVHPTFIRKSHPLASVAGPFNAVSVYGHAVGHTLFYGRGAGGMPTASAVIADVMEVATGNAARTFSQLTRLADRTDAATYRPSGENETAFYLRVGLEDRPGGMARIATVLGDHGISIASLVQHEPHQASGGDAVPVVVTTRESKDSTVQAAIKAMSELDAVIGQVICIPTLDEHVESSHA